MEAKCDSMYLLLSALNGSELTTFRNFVTMVNNECILSLQSSSYG